MNRKEECGQSLLVAACDDLTIGGLPVSNITVLQKDLVWEIPDPNSGQQFFALQFESYHLFNKKINKKLINLGSFLFEQ